MTRDKIRKYRRQIEKLRRKGGVSWKEMVSLARKIGRVPDTSRGKEPTYTSIHLPRSRPITIPHHEKDLTPGVKSNVLDDLERDLDELEAIEIGSQNRRYSGHGGNGNGQ